MGVDPVDLSAQLELFKMIGGAHAANIDSSALIRQIVQRLNEGGLPIMRIGAGFPTLHPTVMGFDITWRRQENSVEKRPWLRSAGEDPKIDFDLMPFSYMSRNDLTELKEDLTSNVQSRFPLVQQLQEAGATGYFATTDKKQPGPTRGPLRVFYTSWATDRPGGFADDDLDLVRAIVPAIGTAVRAMSNYDLAYDLLCTYLGRNAGRKVIEGSVARGSVEEIDAAIIYADLVGFTQTADQEPKEELADLLNAYFDVLVSTIRDHDGEVLKFIGDGLLAIFPFEGGRSVAKAALDASAAILRQVDTLRDQRIKAGKITAEMSIALHRGALLYGNVGSADRLDFTVIGPAVNEASRIEALCRGQQQRLIVSSAFAESAEGEADRLVSLGRFALRGVRKPQHLYTLDLDEETT